MTVMTRDAAPPGIWQAARRYLQRKPVPMYRSGDTLEDAPDIPLSLVVLVPHGISRALLPPEILAAADGRSLEIIFVDASENFVDQSRPGIRHLHLGGAGLFAMVQAGLEAASKDWVILLEDHARPLPNFLGVYRAAIAANPDIDLFFGGLENMTSTSPWSYACFFYGKLDYWPPAGLRPTAPTLANSMVRWAAILPEELAKLGGLQFGTFPRMRASGRQMYCPEAVIDHVRWFTMRETLVQGFHGGRMVTSRVQMYRSGQSAARRLMHDALIAIHGFTLQPWRVMRGLRGTPQGSLLMGMRMMVIGMSRAAGMVAAYVAGEGDSAVRVSDDLG